MSKKFPKRIYVRADQEDTNEPEDVVYLCETELDGLEEGDIAVYELKKVKRLIVKRELK